MASVQNFLDTLSGYIWGPFVLIPLLFLTGLYLTFRLGGLQFTRLVAALNLGVVKRRDLGSRGDITQYQALTTALAATVGTGNIVGVATAIAIGGPGALFWMWVTGLLGMATKYAEAFLAVRFRTADAKGERNGGPQHYLERGIKGPLGKVLAWSFTIFTVFATFGIGNMTQANAISANMENSFSLPIWITAVILTVATMVVLVGGIKSIGRVTAALVPGMVVLYIAAAVWVLGVNVAAIPNALAMIFEYAFTGSAAAGGFAGAVIIIVIQFGFARGMFSNESGLGSAPIAAAAAQTTHPVRQGLVSMTQTFIDTIVVVTMTGLVIVTTGAYTFVEEGGEQISAALMTGAAFSEGLPGNWGHWIVTISLALFAFSTLLGWSYYGERNMEKIFGVKSVMPYRVFFSLVVFVGATTELEIVWSFSDVMNGLMALPNLIGLIILSGLVTRETKAYLEFDPKLDASREEVHAALANDPGFQAWRAQEDELDRLQDEAANVR